MERLEGIVAGRIPGFMYVGDLKMDNFERMIAYYQPLAEMALHNKNH